MNKDKLKKVSVNKKDKTVVFIISDVRSGSTWLSYVLGSHQQSVHLGEYYRPYTMKGHIACRLCEAQGKSECDYLHGIDEVEKENAFDFAFDRFQTPILIDCSKSLDWLKLFIYSRTFQIKIIHLWRDPRAWFASQKRRNQNIDVTRAMKSWGEKNMNIVSELDKLCISYESIFYDDLCLKPVEMFTRLGQYIGMPFERESLNYWKFEHHGLGGNGAAFNNLSQYSKAKVITADDSYYIQRQHKLFYDSRWKNEISEDEKNTIQNNKNINDLLLSNHKSFEYFDKLFENANSAK